MLGQPGGVQATHELAQLVGGEHRLLARLVEQRRRGVGLEAARGLDADVADVIAGAAAMATARYASRPWRTVNSSCGKRAHVPSGKLTTSSSRTSAHGVPSIANS
jgi:hypothetical protein